MSATKRIIALAALILIAMPISMASQSRYSTREAKPDVFSRTASYDGGMVYLSSTGAAMYSQNATLIAMDVKAGDMVSAGDVVGSYSIEVSRADIVRAENALNHAAEDYEYEKARRMDEIDALNALSAEAKDADQARIYQLQAMRAALETERYAAEAEGQIASLESALANLKSSAEIQNICAPMTGMVDSVAEAGLSISPGQTLIAMHDPQAVLIRVSDPDGYLRYGMTVQLQLNSRTGKSSCQGTVVSCDSVLPAALRTGAAYIAYDAGANGSAYYGASVTAETMRVENVLIASPQAIFYNDGRCCVQILDADGTVRTRYVSKGLETASDVWIISGISEGDKLITK